MHHLDGYEFLEQLQTNAVWEAWRARKTKTDQSVIIKVMASATHDSKAYGTLIKRAEGAASRPHTNLANLLKVIEQDDQTYFITEFVEGETLQSIVQRDGGQSESMILSVAACVAGMLEGSWRKHEVVHGDVSPSSIMVDSGGVVKLTGLGQPFDPRSHPCCKAPEQEGLASSTDPRSDMFGLGKTLLYLANGRHPEPGTDADTPIRVPHLAPLVTRLTERDVADRFVTWTDILSAIDAITPARSKRRPTPGPRQHGRVPHPSAGKRSTPGPRRNTARPRPDYMARFRPKKVPLWFRFPAWLLLLAFFAFLTHRQINRPILQTIWQPPLPEPRASRLPWGPRPAATPRVRTTPVPNQATADHAGDARTAALTPAESATLADIATRIAAALMNDKAAMGQRVAATARTGASPALDAALAELEALAGAAEDLDAPVAAVFANNIGKETPVSFGDTRRQIVPMAVAGGQITVTLADAGGQGEPLTFSVAELDPGEKRRLLGAPRHAEDAVIQFLLCARAGEWRAARMLAPACGPLAHAFTRQVDATSD